MDCSCTKKTKPDYTPYLHYIAGQEIAMYAVVKITENCKVPYWCKSFSAYNNSPAVGSMTLTAGGSPLLTGVAAKYSLPLLAADIQAGSVKNLLYYGLVLNINGRFIKYNPCYMQVVVYMMPKAQFLAFMAQTNDNPQKQTNTLSSQPAGGNTAADSPGAGKAAGGIAMTLWGLATTIAAH